MTMNRRGFLLAGSAIAGAGAVQSASAQAIAADGRKVTEFGVEPNTGADQTEALQRAINEITAAGRPILLPAGTYECAGPLTLSGHGVLFGEHRLTRLNIGALQINEDAAPDFVANLYGIHFGRAATANQGPSISIKRAHLLFAHCNVTGGGNGGTAVSLIDCTGSVNALEISAAGEGSGIAVADSSLTISDCRIMNCGVGIQTSGDGHVLMQGNQISDCGTGISARGHGLVSGNVIRNAPEFGLKLGDPTGKGSILAQGNMIDGCRIGIGVAPTGDDIFASINMINGSQDGAIRAVAGEELVGPDLALESPEAYLNLTLGGNVAR